MNPSELCLNKQSDVSFIGGFINGIHIFAENVPISAEGINNVWLRTCRDNKPKIGRKFRNALGQYGKQGFAR
jgi:hypothetical protein